MEEIESKAVIKKIMDDGTFDELRHKVVERLKEDVSLTQNNISDFWSSVDITLLLHMMLILVCDFVEGICTVRLEHVRVWRRRTS